MKTSKFMLPAYIIQLVLPMLALTYNNSLISVYLQIAMNVNHDVNAESWQKDACWMSLKTLAKHTRLTLRTLKKYIGILITLGLIEEVWHERLCTYKLCGIDFTNPKKLRNFVVHLEKTLIDTEKNTSKLKTLIETVDNNQIYPMEGFSWNNLPEIRIKLRNAEHAYKGSSLFMLLLEHDDRLLSETKRAELLGCSQPTLSRFIQAFKVNNLIVTDQVSPYNPKRIHLLGGSQIETVVRYMENQEHYNCPICKGEFNDSRSLHMHLSHGNAAHKWLNNLRKTTKCKPNELWDVYDKHHTEFEALQEQQIQAQQAQEQQVQPTVLKKHKQPKDEYMKVPCPCKQTCHQCFNNWKEEFFEPCELARKQAYIAEYGNNDTKQVKQPKQELPKRELNETEQAFAELPIKKQRKVDPDSAPGLLSYFYHLIGESSMNFSKESKQIKNLLTSKTNQLTPEQVRVVLRYMARRGYDDLRFLSSSVRDALLEQRFLNELNLEGTPAYLVKMFYSGHGLEVNQQTLINDVHRVKESINLSSYDETLEAIKYMINIKCNTINFIGNKRVEMKIDHGNNTASRDYSVSQKMRNNPALFDQGEWVYIRDDLIGGRKKLTEVPESYKTRAMEEVFKVFKTHKFRPGYTYLDWAWSIGLDLDQEMYALAISEEPRWFGNNAAFKQWFDLLKSKYSA